MYQGSTIQPKIGECSVCGKYGPLIAGMCHTDYWNKNRMKAAAKARNKTMSGEKGLQNLIDDLDAVFSKVVRLKAADDNGYVECYTCGKVDSWKCMDCGHFVPRDNMSTRYCEANCKPQCKICNQANDGNGMAFAEHLDSDRPGLSEMLREQGREVQDYSRDELKGMFANYSRMAKQLMKLKNIQP